MAQDKVGNFFQDGKTIAQPDVDTSDRQPVVTSRRGVGYHWKLSHARHKPQLFGGGGEIDGVTALIQTHNNRQIEDEATLHGHGDSSLDGNRYQRNQSSANTEFNFSQYKSGALETQENSVLPGESLFTIANTDGLYAGDTTIKIDPYADTVDMTTQALGALHKDILSTGNTQHTGPKMSANPFKRKERAPKTEANKDPIISQVEEEEDGIDVDYYFDNEYYAGKEARDSAKHDFDTGLRRVNMKTSQGRQLQAAATNEMIMAAYQNANDQYADVLKNYHGKAYLGSEEKASILDTLRTDNAKYVASQVGVGEVSRERAKYYHNNKNNPNGTKLNTVLVGV